MIDFSEYNLMDDGSVDAICGTPIPSYECPPSVKNLIRQVQFAVAMIRNQMTLLAQSEEQKRVARLLGIPTEYEPIFELWAAHYGAEIARRTHIEATAKLQIKAGQSEYVLPPFVDKIIGLKGCCPRPSPSGACGCSKTVSSRIEAMPQNDVLYGCNAPSVQGFTTFGNTLYLRPAPTQNGIYTLFYKSGNVLPSAVKCPSNFTTDDSATPDGLKSALVQMLAARWLQYNRLFDDAMLFSQEAERSISYNSNNSRSYDRASRGCGGTRGKLTHF